jgi:hypothetical protein
MIDIKTIHGLPGKYLETENKMIQATKNGKNSFSTNSLA